MSKGLRSHRRELAKVDCEAMFVEALKQPRVLVFLGRVLDAAVVFEDV
jgi:hypothetical protein